MMRFHRILFAALGLLIALAFSSARAELPDYFASGDSGLTHSEELGRDVWYKATAGNERFHMYTFPQRLGGAAMDWPAFLGNETRESRFFEWGLVNDPDCCVPGDDCRSKGVNVTAAETFGMPYCPGDAEVLSHVGRPGYVDPACYFRDANGRADNQNPCDLRFGTSAGVVGFRKFPNPRFDRARWAAATQGKLESWEEIRSRINDHSLERPFLFGISCASCHASFNPENPPADVNHPKWENIKGLVGNQYMRGSEIFGSGFRHGTIEWETMSRTRPGIVDTSIVPNDSVFNPGTMNAIINFSRRPLQERAQSINGWRRVPACSTSSDAQPGAAATCWCDPEHAGKCWQKSVQDEFVLGILKGGEDSIGAMNAIQRVYVNIGMCAETCWANHLTDLRVLNSDQHGYGQTPFNIGQCRRDCPNYRAVEDRLPNLLDFLLSSHQMELYKAKGADGQPRYGDRTELVDELNGELHQTYAQLETERGIKVDVELGRQIFASSCTECHSSQQAPGGDFSRVDFLRAEDKTLTQADGAQKVERGVRADWMGNDRPTPVTRVGTFACRAMHSNHMRGHVWEEFGSDTLRAREAVQTPEGRADGGRGYYRNISLLSLWAYAPFLHNNAMGPEVCGAGPGRDRFYRSPYMTAAGAEAPQCWGFDPSVEGRVRLFRESMRQMLNPETRGRKVTVTDQPIEIPIPALADAKFVIPAGTPLALVGGFRHKEFVADFYEYIRGRSLITGDARNPALARLAAKFAAPEANALFQAFQGTHEAMLRLRRNFVSDRARLNLYLTAYGNCDALDENAGHTFGQDLEPHQKDALVAFLQLL